MYNVVNKYFKILENTKISFFHIEIEDIKDALRTTYNVVADSSWVEKLTDEALKECFKTRIEYTIEELYKVFQEDTKLGSSTGEYLISVTSKNLIIKELKYSDIPLGELIGKRSTGNGGFDYYAENLEEEYIIFGEAKYRKNISAYSISLQQIMEFIDDKKDIADYADIKFFVGEKSGANLLNKKKGYSAGFTFKGYADKLIDNIVESSEYSELLKYKELILIGVSIKYENN